MVTLKPKTDFRLIFEQSKVERAIDRKMNRVLFRTGGFGKKVMSRSIKAKPKKKKYVPTPGTPPRFQTRPGLKLVEFGVDKVRKTVAIGSLRYPGGRAWSKYFNGRRFRQRTLGGKTVPQLVSEGGQAVLETQYQNSGQIHQTRLTYRSFPYDDLAMGPTLTFKRQIIEQEPLR